MEIISNKVSWLIEFLLKRSRSRSSQDNHHTVNTQPMVTNRHRTCKGWPYVGPLDNDRPVLCRDRGRQMDGQWLLDHGRQTKRRPRSTIGWQLQPTFTTLFLFSFHTAQRHGRWEERERKSQPLSGQDHSINLARPLSFLFLFDWLCCPNQTKEQEKKKETQESKATHGRYTRRRLRPWDGGDIGCPVPFSFWCRASCSFSLTTLSLFLSCFFLIDCVVPIKQKNKRKRKRHRNPSVYSLLVINVPLLLVCGCWKEKGMRFH